MNTQALPDMAGYLLGLWNPNFKKKMSKEKKKPIKIHSWKEREAYHYTRGEETLRYNMNCTTHFPITIRPQLSSIAHCFCPLKLGISTLLTWNTVKISQSHWTEGYKLISTPFVKTHQHLSMFQLFFIPTILLPSLAIPNTLLKNLTS